MMSLSDEEKYKLLKAEEAELNKSLIELKTEFKLAQEELAKNMEKLKEFDVGSLEELRELRNRKNEENKAKISEFEKSLNEKRELISAAKNAMNEAKAKLNEA